MMSIKNLESFFRQDDLFKIDNKIDKKDKTKRLLGVFRFYQKRNGG